MSSRSSVADVADALHSCAIHLLRDVRKADSASGLSPQRLSALSVIVYAGPISIGALAHAEGVRSPTMTGIVKGLEEDGLVHRASHPADRRANLLRATSRGRRLLASARGRRLERLTEILDTASDTQLRAISTTARFVESRLAQRGR